MVFRAKTGAIKTNDRGAVAERRLRFFVSANCVTIPAVLALRLFAKLTAYYLGVTLIVLAGLSLFPNLHQFMPFGGVEALMANPRTGLEGMLAPAAAEANIGNLRESLFWLAITVTGALLTALPVSWVYIAIRNSKDYDQSLVDTIIIMPIVVTSIIIIVQNSLALAFSIAGIAAAVRFRNSLKSSGDALFILCAVGIGLSAGIGALELAIVMTVMFNYTFLLLWLTDFGDREGAKRRYMADANGHHEKDKDKTAVAKDKDAATEALPTVS